MKASPEERASICAAVAKIVEHAVDDVEFVDGVAVAQRVDAAGRPVTDTVELVLSDERLRSAWVITLPQTTAVRIAFEMLRLAGCDAYLARASRR